MSDDTNQPSGQEQSGQSQRPNRGRRYYRSRRRRNDKPEGEPENQSAETSQQQSPPEQRRQHQGPRQQQQHRYDVSVVIPLYNEEDSLKELYQQLRSVLQRSNYRYELVFVDDGSTDRSFQNLLDLRRNDQRIKIIRFRRNFGKSAALAVGFEKALGTYVVTMDADLQDDPAEIPSLIKKLEDGHDLVSGWKKVRKDPVTKTIPSKFFNFVTRVMTGIRIHDFNCGLKAYRNEVVKTVNVYGELHRYIPVLAHNAGFKVTEMIVRHRPRKFGRTKFGIGRFWKGYLDLVTVLFTTRYFRRPLHLFGFWGMVLVLAGLAIDGWLAVEWFMGRTALSNRPLFLGGILSIIVGIQFVSIGLLGEMISKSRRTTEEYVIRDYIK